VVLFWLIDKARKEKKTELSFVGAFPAALFSLNTDRIRRAASRILPYMTISGRQTGKPSKEDHKKPYRGKQKPETAHRTLTA